MPPSPPFDPEERRDSEERRRQPRDDARRREPDDDAHEASHDDPLGLDDVDQTIRINELRAQAEALVMHSRGTSDECPPEVEESFLRGLIEYESAPPTTRFDQLRRAGAELPPPEELGDAALHAKLWEAIHVLARLRVFLERTDHLNDRALYTHLWQESLHEPVPDLSPDSGWNNHLDIIGGGSEEDIQLGLKYYDDQETREWWRRDFPNDVIPPHEDPPYDRDRLLPKAAP